MFHAADAGIDRPLTVLCSVVIAIGEGGEKVSEVIESATILDAAAMERFLQAIERELERDSVARPPSDEALSRWKRQAEECLASLSSATLPGRNRLVRRAERFLDSVREIQGRKARYLAQRDAVRSLRMHDTSSAWIPNPEEIPHSPLAASIRGVLDDASTEIQPMALAQPEVSEPPSLAYAASSDGPSSEDEQFETVEGGPDEITARRAAAFSEARRDKARLERIQRAVPRLSRRTDPIMAVEGRLALPDSFEKARALAIAWVRSKGFKLPPDSQGDFEIRNSKGDSATVIGLLEQGLWALQAETADPDFNGRRWRVEMVLLDAQPTPAVSVTLTAISPAGAPVPPTSIPRLVTQLVDTIGLLDTDDGTLFDAGPTYVTDIASLRRVLQAIATPKRARPVLVLSTYLKNGRPKQFMDPVGLSKRLVGLAQVVVLEREMMWPFNDAVGRKAAVYGASIRLFRPGFTREDEPGSHPIWSPTEISAQGLNLNGLSSALLREAASESLRVLEREDAIPAFDRVREMVFRRQIAEARQKADLAASQRASGDEVASLKTELDGEIQLRKLFEDDNRKLATDLESVRAERNALRDERDLMRGRNLYLESRLQELQLQLREAKGAVDPPYPDNWDDLEEWCEEYLGERVILTRKALRAAQDSRYEKISFVYRVLWFLADQYVPSRRGGGEDYKNGLKDLGLEISPVGRGSKERRSRDTYSTDYKHERVSLDWHVKGSNDRDPRYGFRIYFHWHEGDQCMVVGYLPEHLDNALS